MPPETSHRSRPSRSASSRWQPGGPNRWYTAVGTRRRNRRRPSRASPPIPPRPETSNVHIANRQHLGCPRHLFADHRPQLRPSVVRAAKEQEWVGLHVFVLGG